MWQALLETASEDFKRELQHKNCDLCLDDFMLELLRDIDMLLVFGKKY